MTPRTTSSINPSIYQEYIRGSRFRHFDVTPYEKGSAIDPKVVESKLKKKAVTGTAVIALIASASFVLFNTSPSVTGFSVTGPVQSTLSQTSGFINLIITALAIGVLVIELITGEKVTNATKKPTNHNSYFNNRLGNILKAAENLVEKDQPEKALKIYTHVLTTHPRNKKALLNKGFVLDELKMYEEAIKCYDNLIESHPKDSKAFYNKGISLLETGTIRNITNALDCFDKALKLNMNDIPTIRKICFILFKKKQYTKVINLCNKALSFDKRNIDLMMIKGLALEHNKRPKQALKCYNSALKIDPQDAWAYKCRHELKKSIQ